MCWSFGVILLAADLRHVFWLFNGLFCILTWRKCRQQHLINFSLVRTSAAISFLSLVHSVFHRKFEMWITRIVFDRPPINIFQMWKSTEVSVSQNISMDHVLIKNVCILLCARAVSPETWNLWPTLKTALLQFPNFCWTLFLSICSNFLHYVGVCFGCDLLPTVTLAVIYLYVGKLPFYANIPARTTEEWPWIMSSHHNSFSVKEIYFHNLELWTPWNIWMSGPLFLGL